MSEVQLSKYARKFVNATQRNDGALMILSDLTILLDTTHPDYENVREQLHPFAELIKTPEYLHTYQLTPLSLWNAAASGKKVEEILSVLQEHSRYPLTLQIEREIREFFGRYGMLKMEQLGDELLLSCSDPVWFKEMLKQESLQSYILRWKGDATIVVDPTKRGLLKQTFIQLGYPVEDIAGYSEGAELAITWRSKTTTGKPFSLRPYQTEAVDRYYAGGSVHGGSGVLVLPCGAGKTLVGIAAAVQLQSEVLILTSNVSAARQWKNEFLDKTTVLREQIGEYTGISKQIRPVTIATYQILSYRKSKEEPYEHLSLFSDRNWGLIIYDEVHLLPAPVFRITADIQAKRRLGLTATLIREDGKEKEVFSLIGPKKMDIPWRTLEEKGWIARAVCREIRVTLTDQERKRYDEGPARTKWRIAAEAHAKIDAVRQLVDLHPDEQVLIIGQYIEQLKRIANVLQAPLITGRTKHEERDRWFHSFRTGNCNLLVLSKLANLSIDLPNASVAIQVSGQFGSRQEEAQRLGRIMRPKTDRGQATFYTLVTDGTIEADFAVNRQRFLTEQGYRYEISHYFF